MSSKRDLVEAHSFSRRRLVTAFVSGAPGGREVEPVRPGRMLIGGVAIAVLLVAGAAVAGVIKPRTPAKWLDSGVVIAKETGADYAIVEKGDPLRPLVNATSAQLLFGSELEPKSVAQKEINDEEIGEAIGIYGAPDALPTSDRLVGTGWTACTNGERGTKFLIASSPGVTPVTGQAVIVEDTKGAHFLVAASPSGAFRLALPSRAGDRDGVVNAVAPGSAGTLPVTSDWLGLFPPGPALEASSFPVSASGAGRPAGYAAELGSPQLKVGDLAEYVDGRIFLAGDRGPVPLSAFAKAVYLEVAGAVRTHKISSLDKAFVHLPQGWPDDTVTQMQGSEACAVLDAEAGRAATVTLGTDPEGDAAAGTLREALARVEPGLGAYVLAGGHLDPEGGQPVVIDSQGKRYRLGGPAGEAADRLGYGSYDAPTIPDGWVERYTCGPELSLAAAAQAPDPKQTCRGL